MSYSHVSGRGIGLLVSSFIYIVIEQRLLFLVFTILNVIGAILYSIYFLLSMKFSKQNVTVLNKTDVVPEEGNVM